jgi:hypothetical protein
VIRRKQDIGIFEAPALGNEIEDLSYLLIQMSDIREVIFPGSGSSRWSIRRAAWGQPQIRSLFQPFRRKLIEHDDDDRVLSKILPLRAGFLSGPWHFLFGP